MKKFILALVAAACMFTSCVTVSSSKYTSNVDASAEGYKYLLHVKLNSDSDPVEFAKIQKKMDSAFANTRLTIVEDADSLSDEQQQNLLTYECAIEFDETKTKIKLILADYNNGKEIAKFIYDDYDNAGSAGYENAVAWLCDSIQNGFAK